MNLTHHHARLLINVSSANGLLRNQTAYLLATTHHETGGYKWLREIWGPTAAQRRYEGRKDLGNTQPGDGKRFMGRGFCHITGRRNYEDWSIRLGIDLVSNPALAEKPEIAAKIIVKGMLLGTFTGKKLSDYITLNKSDFTGARRIINGTDKSSLIAGYAKDFDAMLKAEGYGVAAPPGPTKPVSTPNTDLAPKPPVAPPVPSPVAKVSFWAALLNLILKLLGREPS